MATRAGTSRVRASRRVEQQADAEREGDLAEALDRDQGDRGEGEGEDDAGDGDRPAGANAGAADRRPQLLVIGLRQMRLIRKTL